MRVTRVDAMIEMGKLAQLMKAEKLTVQGAVVKFFERGYTKNEVKAIFERTEEGYDSSSVTKAWNKFRKPPIEKVEVVEIESIKPATAVSRFNRKNGKPYEKEGLKIGANRLERMVKDRGIPYTGISSDQYRMYPATELMSILEQKSDFFNEI